MKNLMPLLILPILLLSTLSGCISEKGELVIAPLKNMDPIPVLTVTGTIDLNSHFLKQTTADAFAYKGKTITFDASDSYDPDGNIVSYEWILDEKNTKGTGPVVSHSYKIDDASNFSYTEQIILMIEDNNGSIIFHTFVLGIIPKKIMLYLDAESLHSQKPEPSIEKVEATLGKLRPLNTLHYQLINPIQLSQCTWNATVYIKKSLFSIVTKVSITLYNSTGMRITEAQSMLRPIRIGKEKTITFNGIIDTQVDFTSLELRVYGLSFGKKVGILYGAKKASSICFDFNTDFREMFMYHNSTKYLMTEKQ